MGDLLRFPPRLRQVDPAPAQPPAIPDEGFGPGDRVTDTVTGRRGTVRGAVWCGGLLPRSMSGEIVRPLRYEVEWDGELAWEDVVACRLVPLRPMLAPREPGRPGVATLHARRISPALWWPGRNGDDPKGAA